MTTNQQKRAKNIDQPDSIYKEHLPISVLNEILPTSITGLKGFIYNKVYNSIIDNLTKSIVLTFYHYNENVSIGESNKLVSVLRYISILYSKSNKKNKGFVVYPYAGNPNKHIRLLLPDADIQFLCADKLTICSVKFINVADNDDDGKVVSNKNVKISFIGKNATKYIKPIYKLIIQQSLNIDFDHNDGFIYMSKLNGTSKLYLNSFKDIIMDNKEELLINPLKKFLESKDLYQKYHINYNLGVLLYGQPGCGKTTIFKAIINTCIEYYSVSKCNVYYLDLAGELEHINRGIDTIAKYVSGDDDIRIVLMEEVDSIFPNDRDNMNQQSKDKLNLLLQFLDGTASPNNTIFVATTNFYDKLDEAFKRDGRFNIKVEVEPFKEKQAKEMCDKFEVDYSILEEVKYPINPTTLQKHIFFKEYN